MNRHRAARATVCAALAFVLGGGAEANWDIIPYLDCVLDGTTDREAGAVWRALDRELPPWETARLAGARPPHRYRRTLARTPEALAAQRGFYCPKRGYIAAAQTLVAAGVGPVGALRGLSRGAAAFTAGLVGWLLPWSAAGTAVALILAAVLAPLGAVVTPDALATLVATLLAWAVLRRRPGLALLAGVALAAVRPDHALLPAFIGLTQLAMGARSPSATAPAPLALVLAPLIVAGLATQEALPWAVHLHHAFVSRLPRPDQAAVVLDGETYLTVLLRQGHRALAGAPGLTTLVAVAAATRTPALGAGAALATIAHTLAMPLVTPRLVAPMLVVGVLALMWEHEDAD